MIYCNFFQFFFSKYFDEYNVNNCSIRKDLFWMGLIHRLFLYLENSRILKKQKEEEEMRRKNTVTQTLEERKENDI